MPIINGTTASEDLTGTSGHDQIYGFAGHDVLSGLGGNDQLYGGGGNDRLLGGGGHDFLMGGLGDDIINGGAGYDTVSYREALGGITIDLATGIVTGADGTDTLHNIEYAIGSNFDDIISGTSEEDFIVGGDGDDIIDAGDTDEPIQVPTGAPGEYFLLPFPDEVLGGTGNDIFIISGENRAPHIDGEAGIDTLDLSTFTDGSYTVNLTNEFLISAAELSGWGVSSTIHGVENVIGTQAGDIITGDAGINELTGGGGDDTLDGGDGDDTAIFHGQRDDYTVSFTAGIFTIVDDNTADGLDEGTDALSNIESLSFSDGISNAYSLVAQNVIDGTSESDANILGTINADLVNGLEGDDHINASLGDDFLFGGTGNDILIGGGGADVIDGGEGTDEARYSNSNAAVIVNLATNEVSGGHAEGDILSKIENLFGSNFGDTLTGDAGDNLINGFTGDDILFGMDGTNTLIGGSGNDNFIGGDGDDLHNGGSGFADTIDYSNSSAGVTAQLGGAQTFDGGDATGDTFRGIEYLIGSDFDDNLVGTLRRNILTGNDGDDFINAAGGKDDLFGGEGNDTLIGGAGADILDGGAGIDTARYVNSNVKVIVSLDTGTGTAGHSAQDTLIDIENLFGSTHDDRLTGDSGANDLNGHTGNDILTGGLGADTFSYGTREDFGADIITDFEIGIDKINLVSLENIRDFNQLLIENNAEGNAVISIGSGSIELEGIDASLITEDDFLIISSGIGFGSGQYYRPDNAGNDAFSTAIDISDSFALNADIDIIDATTIPHMSIHGEGDGSSRHYYAVDLLLPGTTITLDVDHTDMGSNDLDTVIWLYDETGTLVAVSDNSSPSRGEGGSTGFEDSFLTFEVQTSGTYYIVVGATNTLHLRNPRYPDYGDNITPDTSYELQVSVDEGGLAGVNIIHGTAENDLNLLGTAENDVLISGLDGNDQIAGLLGEDTINGGNGFDMAIYQGSLAGYSVTEQNGIVNVEDIFTTVLDEGSDILTSIEFLQFFDGIYTVDSILDVQNIYSHDVINGTTGADANIAGTVNGDIIKGLEGDDQINASQGNDSLFGDAGDDVLIGSGGADALNGGAGSDSARYINSDAAVTVNLATGEAVGGHAEGDIFASIENLFGSNHDDTLTGDDLSNDLNGHTGNDILTGGLGADSFTFTGASFGNDRVTDFEDGTDIIDMSGVTGLNDFAQLLIANNGQGDAVISFNGNTIELDGIDASLLTVDDFVI